MSRRDSEVAAGSLESEPDILTGSQNSVARHVDVRMVNKAAPGGLRGVDHAPALERMRSGDRLQFRARLGAWMLRLVTSAGTLCGGAGQHGDQPKAQPPAEAGQHEDD